MTIFLLMAYYRVIQTTSTPLDGREYVYPIIHFQGFCHIAYLVFKLKLNFKC